MKKSITHPSVKGEEAQKSLLVIVGPTGSGKSALAVALALRLSSGQARKRFGLSGAEIVSADSRQVYRGINIGTGKLTKREMRGIPHHLIDITPLRRIYTVTQYQRDARRVIRDIWRRGKLPILCGGTGLYVRSVVDGVVFPPVPPNPKLRARLEKKRSAELYRLLVRKDPRRAKEIDRHNPRRLIRALEVAEALGRVPTPHARPINTPVLMLGLTLPRAERERRTRARIRAWLRRGLLAEVRRVPRGRTGELGLVYRWAARFANGEIARTAFMESLTRDLLRYARRQDVWFRRSPRIHWIYGPAEAFRLARKFLAR